ncbi:MAG: retropepsin-like aspartic protease [Phycisphaeraceae bacterium]
MPHLTARHSADGPVLDIQLAIPRTRTIAMAAAGVPVTPAIEIRALVDTGATITVISTRAFARLGLEGTGTTQIIGAVTANQPVQVQTCDVSLILVHKQSYMRKFDPLPVIIAPLGQSRIDALIGRDVLQSCLFLYDGQAGTCTLAF